MNNSQKYAFVKISTADGNWFNYNSGPNKGQPMSNADVRKHFQKTDPSFLTEGGGEMFSNYMRMSSPHGIGPAAGAQAGVPSGAPQAPQAPQVSQGTRGGHAAPMPAAPQPPVSSVPSNSGQPASGSSAAQIWASKGGSPTAGPIGMSGGGSSTGSGGMSGSTASNPWAPGQDPFANPKPPINEPRMEQSPDGSWSVRPADGQMFGGLPGNPTMGKQSPTGIGTLPGAQAEVPSQGPEGPPLPAAVQQAWNNRSGQAGRWN